MLYPITLKALRPLVGSYGWPPGVRPRTSVNAGESFVTDNEAAEKLQAAGLAERADRVQSAPIQPTGDIMEIIRSLKRKMAQPAETPIVEVSENKMLPVIDNKNGGNHSVKRGRGRPKGSKNKLKE